MVEGNLDTTNVLLAIMAAVSVLQGIVLVAAGILGYRLYRQVMTTVREVEERQIAPLADRVQLLVARVDGILADVKDLTERVSRGTERVDAAIAGTAHRVDETAGRVRASVASRLIRLAGLAHGVRVAVTTLFNGRRTRASAA